MNLVAVIALISLLVLMLSHRVYLAYVNAVAREERHALRLDKRLHHHIGPHCFLVLDTLALLGVVISLETLIFGRPSWASPGSLGLMVTRFSVLVAFWMLREGEHLERFYGKLAHLRAGSRIVVGSDRLIGNVRALLVGMALTPLFLEIMGIELEVAGRSALITLFLACFILPQFGLLALSARRILPLRRAVLA